MKSNANDLRLTSAEDVETESQQNNGAGFYDPSNPVLAPAKDTKKRKKSWKRKLIGWSLLLVALLGAVVAVYYLIRISHVDVRVLADNRKASESKPKPSPTANENALSAEAINIAREAIGADTPRQNTSALNTTPTLANASATNNGIGPVNDLSSSVAPTSTNEIPPSLKVELRENEQSQTTVQSHANTTQSLTVEDPPIKVIQPQPTSSPSPPIQSKPVTEKLGQAISALPPFGTMLPVRTQSAIFTLRNDSYARLEITRDASGDGWSLSKGTVFIGRTRGSELDRAFVNIIGYIDPRENRLSKLGGEVLGSDGASGLQGKRVSIDKTGFKRTLNKVASQGLQVAGMMAGALTGRGTVVINGARPLSPLIDEAGRVINSDEKRSFVKVDAGQSGYVMISELPKALSDVQIDKTEDPSMALSDRDVMELILFGTPEEVRAAFPLMTSEQKTWAQKNYNQSELRVLP